jgi:glycosyltransferase involved in cell wall biosynthesis
MQYKEYDLLISIITPTYNSSQFIRETIDSIINQTYAYWELLITDDCSTDDTWNILNEYIKKDNRIKIFRLDKNSGAGISRNHSIEKASGRYIAFCDSDDVWIPEKLEKQISFMQQNKLAFTYSAYQKITETGELKGVINPPLEISYTDLLKTCSIGCLTAIYDTYKIGKIYMSKIRKRQDYALWLNIFKKINKTKGLNEVLGYYRICKKSISRNKTKAAYYHFRVLREVGNISFIKSCYYFIIYLIYGIIKYLR